MFCPNCGKEYSENQNFCRYCGTKLHEIYTETPQLNTDSESCDNKQDNNHTSENTVDLTVSKNVESFEEQEENQQEPKENIKEENQDDSDLPEEENETIEEEVSDFFTDLKKSLIIETPEGKKLTPSAITLLVVLFIFVVCMANLLWSINDAIQINPSMTNDNALMNISSDNEDRAYTQAPEQTEEPEEEEVKQEETPAENEYAAQPEEPPVVPIDEVRQREQQFPEPEIPMPQDFPDESTH